MTGMTSITTRSCQKRIHKGRRPDGIGAFVAPVGSMGLPTRMAGIPLTTLNILETSAIRTSAPPRAVFDARNKQVRLRKLVSRLKLRCSNEEGSIKLRLI